MSGDEQCIEAGLARPRPPRNRRRDKPQLSCNSCRHKKLKCDRTQPCANCSRRGVEAHCTYASRNPSARVQRHGVPVTSTSDVQERLRKLEDQLDTMVHCHTSTHGMRPSSPFPTPAGSSEGNGAATPLNAGLEDHESRKPPDFSNWSTILRGLKRGSANFECSYKQRMTLEAQQSRSPGPLLLYGCRPAQSFDELLAAFPTRPRADRMVSAYFNGLDLSSAIIHGPSFLKEYENFWNNPKETSPLWLALLYGMLSTAAQFQLANPEKSMLSDETLSTSFDQYREKVVQCLMFGRYTNGGPYVLQALMHYIVIELFEMKEADIGVWLLMGIIVNIANRMGYHCDPVDVYNISPYETEMRRRWWMTLIVLDNAISESVGMQRLIKNVENVSEPRNLLDSDFDPSTIVLPPSRPDTEPTPMLYCLAKNRALTIFSMVSDLVTASRPPAYSEVLKADAMLMRVQSEIPTCYKWRSLSQCITDSVQIICRRMYLEIVYLKARVVLHLKYVMPSEDQDQQVFSRKMIFDTVSKLLEFHHICDEETQPAGQLFSARWRYLFAVNQNFLLASVAACFYLEHNRSNMDAQELEGFKKLCRKSQGIWIRASRSSVEASKAAEALRIALDEADGFTVTHTESSEQELMAGVGTITDVFDNPQLPDYFGGCDLPFSYFSLFDGLNIPNGPITHTPDSLLVPPMMGQSSEYLGTASWNHAGGS